MGMHACAATTAHTASSSTKPPAPSSDFARRNESASARSFAASGPVRVATIGSDRRTVRHAASETAGRSGFRNQIMAGGSSAQGPGRAPPAARRLRRGFARIPIPSVRAHPKASRRRQIVNGVPGVRPRAPEGFRMRLPADPGRAGARLQGSLDGRDGPSGSSGSSFLRLPARDLHRLQRQARTVRPSGSSFLRLPARTCTAFNDRRGSPSRPAASWRDRRRPIRAASR